jgi:hypothetical protein
VATLPQRGEMAPPVSTFLGSDIHLFVKKVVEGKLEMGFVTTDFIITFLY